MRTTLDIEDDVLQAAKELALHQCTTAGKVISALARKGLQPASNEGNRRIRNGIRMLSRGDEIVTLEHVQRIIDQEGI